MTTQKQRRNLAGRNQLAAENGGAIKIALAITYRRGMRVAAVVPSREGVKNLLPGRHDGRYAFPSVRDVRPAGCVLAVEICDGLPVFGLAVVFAPISAKIRVPIQMSRVDRVFFIACSGVRSIVTLPPLFGILVRVG